MKWVTGLMFLFIAATLSFGMLNLVFNGTVQWYWDQNYGFWFYAVNTLTFSVVVVVTLMMFALGFACLTEKREGQ